MPGGIGARALPDLVSHMRVDTSQLKVAEMEAKAAGVNIGNGLGVAGKSAKAAENDVANLAKRMGAAGVSTGRWTTLLGGGMGLTPALLGAAVAADILFAAGKSIIEVSDRWESSQKSLAQATAAQGVNLNEARKFTDTFIQTNKKYIETQTDVVDGYASLTRSGLKQHEVQRDLNIAIDLAALKHLSLIDAIDLVNKAEHGRMRGLVDLGIVTKSQTDADGNLIGGTKNVAAAMDAVEKKTAGGRDTLSDMKKATNDLGGTWQTFAAKNGPGFTKFLSGALTVATAVADAIGWILQKSLDLQNAIGNAIGGGGSSGMPTAGHWENRGRGQQVWVPGTPANRSGARASGGLVVPGGIYTVGERGPETLVMGSRGGTVIPHGGSLSTMAGGGNVTLHVQGFVGNPQELFKVFREGIRRLDRAQAT